MNNRQLQEYVAKAKELELSCYQQELLCNHLKGTIVDLRKNQEQTAEGKIAANVRHDNVFVMVFLYTLYAAFIGVLIGLGIGLIVGIIVAIVQFYTGLSDHNILIVIYKAIVGIFSSDGWKVIGHWIINGLKWGTIGGTVVGVVMGIFGRTTKQDAAKINQEIKQRNNNIDTALVLCEQQISIVQQELMLAEKTYQETIKTREKFYAVNVIYVKYQSLVPVAMFDEYLRSGRCSTLEGHEGAYNLYENEKMMNLIVTKLDDIIDRLDEIADNQRLLANEIKAGRMQVSKVAQSINQSLQTLEESAEASQYYNQITARNTSFMAWLSYFKS